MGAAIPLVIGAVSGGLQAREQEKATTRFNRGQSAANRFSDVTGRFGQLRQAPAGGILGGALKGASSFGGLANLVGGLGKATNAASNAEGIADVGGQNFIGNQNLGGGFVGGQPVQPLQTLQQDQIQNRFGALARGFGRS